MGQVWSKADFDGTIEAGHEGGRGSVLAVTAQNAGSDGRFDTPDDRLAPLNFTPVDVSLDAMVGPDCGDPLDRVRGFYSLHLGGANFLFGDGTVRFVSDQIAPIAYLAISTIDGAEVVADPGL